MKTGNANTSCRGCVPVNAAALAKRIRSNLVVRFYFDHLKRYPTAQWVASRAWQMGYALYRIAWIHRKSLQFPLLAIATYRKAGPKFAQLAAESVPTPTPEAFPADAAGRLVSPHAEFYFPEVSVTPVADALVTGGTNLIMAGSAVICHDLYDFARDYTSEELNGRSHIWPTRRRIAWLMPTTPQLVLDTAAGFTDACSANYAHWLTEILPRINHFCASSMASGVPLIVDSGLHRNIMVSISIVAGTSREVVTLPPGAAASVKHLFVTSPTGYVPFERRTSRLRNHSHGRFSPQGLLSLRTRLMTGLRAAPSNGPRRILIRRNSKIRNITNHQEIEKVLVSRGFTVVEPERLTFDEQVALFSCAEVVVAATGAACANLIFCKPSTKIVILISDHKHMPYWYWQNMACAVGNRVTYVIGKCVDRLSHIHSHFVVSPSDVCDAVEVAHRPAQSNRI